MSDPELKLNSLSRYTKQSPRLVLEEHSSCEVPAGCGGVVLRWRNPVEPLPMIVRSSLWWNGEHEEIAFDGKRSEPGSKVPITYGKHALTLVVRDFDPEYAFVLMTGHLDAEYVRVLQLEGERVFISVPDNTWRYTLKQPEGDAWQQPDFEDHSWQPMVQKPFGPMRDVYEDWRRSLTEQGAVGLGIDIVPSLLKQIKSRLGRKSTLPAIYIRKAFIVSQRRKQEEAS
jgi:hypothetical protein